MNHAHTYSRVSWNSFLTIDFPFIDFIVRWCEFLYEMIKNFKDSTSEKTVLIVTHGGMIRVITKYLLQFSSRPLGLNLAHCGIGNNSISVFELEVSDSKIVNCDVVKVFDCKHLARSC